MDIADFVCINCKNSLADAYAFKDRVECKTCGQRYSINPLDKPFSLTIGNGLFDGDTVNHPTHYGGDGTYETIKVVEAWKLDFNLGNAIKYISRAEHKGHYIEDLEKAKWYIERAIRNATK